MVKRLLWVHPHWLPVVIIFNTAVVSYLRTAIKIKDN